MKNDWKFRESIFVKEQFPDFNARQPRNTFGSVNETARRTHM